MVKSRGRLAAEDRIRMADQCSRFLTWALRNPRYVPSIPRQRDGNANFSPKLRKAFWGHALEEIEKGLANSTHPDDF